MRVALVYDRVNKWGGAERLLLALKKIYPQADLYTSVYNERASWSKVFRIKTSFLQNFPFASSNHELFATLMPIAFENFSFDGYDLVFSVTSESAKGIITKPGTLHICFCLTPTRYLWSGYKTYFRNPILRFISMPVISYLRFWDLIASRRPDLYIAISKEVHLRIKKYYDLGSKVIYPPLMLKDNNKKIVNGNYFLIVSRLVPYKKIDLAIKACNKLNLPLKIVGIGSQEYYLKSIAGKNVEFLGLVSDLQLVDLYKKCKALIFPGPEDFGTVMVEAQFFGKPVIALRQGGALEIIKEGETGEFFGQPTVESLKEVLANFDVSRYNSKNCQANADKFHFDNFSKNLTELIDKNKKIYL